MIDRLLNEKEAAEYLGIPEEQLRELARGKKIPAYRIGGEFLRFDPKDLDHVRGFIKASLTKAKKDYSFFARFKDYFYYNDFYIIVAILIIILLALVFKASF